MKLGKLKPSVKKERFFYQDDKIAISGQEKDGKIISFKGRKGKVEKVFKVVKQNVLLAWQNLEHFFDKI